jgi:hypothetical protein
MIFMHLPIDHTASAASDLLESLIGALLDGGWKIDRRAPSQLGVGRARQ